MKLDTDPDVRQAFQDLVAGQPFEPDPVAIRRRARRAHQRTLAARGGAVVGLAALLAAGAAVAVTGAGPAPSARPPILHTATTPSSATHTPGPPATASGSSTLAQLADVLLAAHTQPAGDATLEIKQARAGSKSATTYEIFADNGRYYFALSPNALIAEVQGHSPGGATAQEIAQGQTYLQELVAAAKKAATGSLAAARNAVLDAGLPAGTTPPTPNQAQQAAGETAAGQTENYIWENARTALIADPGDPTVRAGVLRVIATLHDVTVTRTTTDGRPTLTLLATGAAAGGGNEQLVITADTGIPVAEAEWGSDPSNAASATYQVSRVTLADVAAGRL